MNLRKARPLDSPRTRPDRLTRLLIWVAIILVAAFAALMADMWLFPTGDGPLAWAMSLAQSSTSTTDLQHTSPPVAPSGSPVIETDSPTSIPASTSTPSDGPKADDAASGGSGTLAVAAHAPVTPAACIPPDDWAIHVVQEGNTLASVARRYGTDVDTLMYVNCLNTSTIFVNQRLYVPGELAPPGSATPPPTSIALQEPTETPQPEPSAPPTLTPWPELSTTLPETPTFTPSPTGTTLPGATAPAAMTATASISNTSTAQLHASATEAVAVVTAMTPTGTLHPTASATSEVEGIMDSRPTAAPTWAFDPVALSIPMPTATPKTAFRVNIPNRYLNIVLMGSDKRPKGRAWRTDSMIVVSVDLENNRVRLLSIPRDLWVYIPNHGYNRVNTADLWGELAKKGGGPERVKRTIHHNLGIPIHYYVRVDFEGFMKIIDHVGGVDIDVDCALSDIKLRAGMHHMNGQEALRYARSRKSTSDFDRGRRQRKVLMALWDQALTMDIIPKLPQLWVTMADTFQTDLPLEQVINLAFVGAKLKPQHIQSKAITRMHVKSWRTPQGWAVLLPREDKLRAMLESYYEPQGPIELDSAEKTSVEVRNGSQRHQADELAAAALRWEGFKVSSEGPTERQNQAKTKILVHNGDLDAGKQIADQLRVPATAVENATGASNPADIEVILGQDYNPCQR